MKIYEMFAQVLAFRTVPTTLLLVLVYVGIFSSVLITDNLQKLPKKGSAELEEAYADLHQVSVVLSLRD
jgi:hypothetical protein